MIDCQERKILLTKIHHLQTTTNIYANLSEQILNFFDLISDNFDLMVALEETSKDA